MAGLYGIGTSISQRRDRFNRRRVLITACIIVLAAAVLSTGLLAFFDNRNRPADDPFVQRLRIAHLIIIVLGGLSSYALEIAIGISLCFYDTSLDILKSDPSSSGQTLGSGTVIVSGYTPQLHPIIHDPPPAYKDAFGGFSE